jgi:hypothetical protein
MSVELDDPGEWFDVRGGSANDSEYWSVWWSLTPSGEGGRHVQVVARMRVCSFESSGDDQRK